MYTVHPQQVLNGAMVRTLRQRHGLTQKELGILCDSYQQHVSAWERGINRHIYPRTLARLAEIFGVTLEELITKQDVGVRSARD